MRNKIFKHFTALLLVAVLVSGSMLLRPNTAIAAAATPDLTVQQMLQTPDAPITKGEFARFVNTALGLTDAGGDSFKDVSAENPYASDIAIATATGYYNGIGNGNVQPDKIISGAEAAKSVNFILCAALGFDLSKVSVDSSVDVPVWAKPAASNLMDLAMVSKDLIEKQQLTVADAGEFVSALYVAIMFQGSPYEASQASQQDDFYAYTNRQFLATAQPTSGNYEVSSFTAVQDLVNDQLNSIVSGIISQKNLTPGSSEWKINEIYNMYLDNDGRTKSLDSLAPIFNDIRSAKTIADLDAVSAKYVDMFNLQSFYAIGAYSDAITDARAWAAFVVDGPLMPPYSLPVSYYADSDQTAPIQQAFRDFLSGELKFVGETDNLDQRAEAVYGLLKSAAQKEIPAAQQNDPSVLYTPATWAEMDPITAHGNNVPTAQKAILKSLPVYCPDKDYIQFVNDLYTADNLPALKDIALINVLDSVLSFLGDDFFDLTSAFNAAILGAAPDRDPVETRAAAVVSQLMEPALSNMYAANYGTQATKDDMTQMVETIRQKRIDRINDLDWMTPDTKAKAVDKLKSITAFVAYPDKPIDELSFNVMAQSSGGNLIDLYMNWAKAQTDKQTVDLQKPVDRNMWDSVPTYTVNAYYNPSDNAIIIPIGILQGAFYDPNATRAENLGGIGAVIGHEFTHSVDTTGAQFDKNGTLTNWWTDADYTAFAAKTKQISDALSQITFSGQQLNGELTRGEAIADLGGVSAAISIAQDENLDTGAVMTQWAKVWEDRMPAQAVTAYLSMDVHLPAKLRVNFTLAQQDEFYNVFNVQPGDGMYTDTIDRINIW